MRNPVLLTIVTMMLTTGVARAQTDQAPPPPAADGSNAFPPDVNANPNGDFVPFTPATPAPAATETPTTPPPNGTLPPGVTSTELPPPPQYSEKPVATPQPVARPSGECRDRGFRKGFFRGAIPSWAGGAVVGAAIGALGLSLVALLLAASINFAIVKAWIQQPPSGFPGIYALPLAALPLGAVMGALVGGLVTPFLPNIPLTRPCLDEPGSDPTRTPSGATGAPGTGTG